MELTAPNVNSIIMHCLFEAGESTEGHIKGEGVRIRIGFHPGRLEAKKADIKALCLQLPESFLIGDSFLNACITSKGEQWGEHSNIDELLALGTAVKCIEYLAPREEWPAFAGGMPIFRVLN